MTKNQVMIENLKKVIVEQGSSTLSDGVLAAGLKNISALGFTFSEALLNRVRTLSNEQFSALYFSILPVLREMVGAHVAHKPMYHNFPREVMEMDEAQLYLNAVLHYLHSFVRDVVEDTEGVLVPQGLPASRKEERPALLYGLAPKVLDLGSEEELLSFIQKLIGAKTSISEQHKAVISFAVQTFEPSDLLPGEIPLKENVGFVVAKLLQNGNVTKGVVKPYFKTATDVLRLLVSYSGGDVSLASNTKFVSFPRKLRKLALSLLESCGNVTEDMLRYSDVWKRVAERLHPHEYASRYPKTSASFNVILQGLPFSTFASRIETSIASRDLATAAKYLTKRPGEFARRLDHMLRLSTSENANAVLNSFASVVSEVSTPVLLAVGAHFKNRDSEGGVRNFFPKGNVGKLFAIENLHKPLDSALCERVCSVVNGTLSVRFSELETLGKTYVDPDLSSYFVPFSQRSASKALETVARGSRIPFPEGTTIRTFIYWHEGKMGNGEHTGRIDLDLSSQMFDEEWNDRGTVAYYNLREEGIRSCHSGDVTSAPKGASEYIDVDIESAVNAGVRYIVVAINSFTHHPYCDLPQCFAGWMMRQDPDSGEIFEPTTVVNKFDLTSDTQITIPVVLDLVTREAIWCDLGLAHFPYAVNNVENNKISMQTIARSIAELSKPNLYDLFTLHAHARGTEMVETPEEADTVFSVHQGIKPTDFAEIAANFL